VCGIRQRVLEVGCIDPYQNCQGQKEETAVHFLFGIFEEHKQAERQVKERDYEQKDDSLI